MNDPCFANKQQLRDHIHKNMHRTYITNHIDVGTDEFTILLTNRWFNDKIINFYFSLIQTYAETFNISVYVFSTFFYTSLKRRGYSWVGRYTRNENIFEHDYIFIPVHRPNHWAFVCVDVNNRQIECYDSLFADGPVLADIINYLRQERAAKKMRPVELTVMDRRYPKQSNGYDCGVFVCMYARNRIFGTHMSFDSRNMYEYRLKIAHELIEGEIIYSLGHRLTF